MGVDSRYCDWWCKHKIIVWRENLCIVCCPLSLKRFHFPPDVAANTVDMLLSTGKPESSSLSTENQSIDVITSDWQFSDSCIKVSKVLLTLNNNKQSSDTLHKTRKHLTSDVHNFDRCFLMVFFFSKCYCWKCHDHVLHFVLAFHCQLILVNQGWSTLINVDPGMMPLMVLLFSWS